MKTMVMGAATVGLVLLWGVSGPALGYDVIDVKDGGAISGEIKFKGTAPAPKKITADKDKEACGKKDILDENLVVGSGGGLKNAVVYIADIQKGKKFADAAPTIDQNGCFYAPHVVAAPAGTDIEILNSDGILHNIHTHSTKNAPLNMAQPKFKKKLTQKFAQPEIIKMTCDAHGWMLGYLVVRDNPYYAVTDENGAFKISDVPPGDYEVKVWHENLGEKTQKVSVKAKDEAKVALEMAK